MTLAEALVLLLAGGAIGAVGGLLGIGGGVIAVPVLLDVLAARGLAADAATPVAIGTAQAVILLSSLSAATDFRGRGPPDEANQGPPRRPEGERRRPARRGGRRSR